MRTTRRCLAVSLPAALAALLLAGCESEQVQAYRVPKGETPPGPPAGVRRLGPVSPAGEQSWFFKLSGPIDEVTRQEKPFEDFVRTVALADGKPTWTTPEGWRQQPGEGLRFA